MSANSIALAPSGRKKLARGKGRSDAALGHASKNTTSPEGAKERSTVPVGWEWKTVGEMVEQMQYGTSAKTSEDDSGIPVLRMGNIKDGSLTLDRLKYLPTEHEEFPALLLRDGDLLFNRTNSAELVGKSAVYRGNPSPCSCASYLIRARLKPGYVPEFLAYYINSIFGRRWIRSVVSQQVGQANVNGTKLKALSVPVPSFDEQQRVVAEIEKQFTRLEAAVAALRRMQANLKRYRAAVLKAACEGRLVPTEAELAKAENRKFETGEELLARILTERRQKWQGRGQYKEPAAPEPLPGVELPEGWTWATMPQLGELNRGKSKHRPRDDARLYDGPYPFIQTGEIRRSGGTIREHTQTYSEFGLQQSRLWPEGTLCITIAANIAETGILKFKSCFPDSVVGFTHDGNPATTRYVEFFIRTAKEKLAQFAPATAQKNINLDVLQKVAIPLPPLAEQTRIVAEVERRLSVIEELETVGSADLQRAGRLRQSVLASAFTSG